MPKVTMELPLFRDGAATWMPSHCPYHVQTGEPGSCDTTVEALEPTQGGEPESGRVEVIARPCGHRIWLRDPVEVTLS